jgi:hypothetical protein
MLSLHDYVSAKFSDEASVIGTGRDDCLIDIGAVTQNRPLARHLQGYRAE